MDDGKTKRLLLIRYEIRNKCLSGLRKISFLISISSGNVLFVVPLDYVLSVNNTHSDAYTYTVQTVSEKNIQ